MKRLSLILTLLAVVVLLCLAVRLPSVMRLDSAPGVVKVIDLTPLWVEESPGPGIPPRYPTRLHNLSNGVWQTHDSKPLPRETIKVLSAVFDDDFRFDAPEQLAP